MKHYIILTHGENEEYGIQGLYVCDHAVNPKEWEDAMLKFNKDVTEAGRKIYEKHGGRIGYGHIPAAHEEHIKWMDDNHPWPAFKEKHGLEKVEHTELWTWGV